MKLTTTLLLLLLVGGLSAYVAFYERKTPDTKHNVQVQINPFAFTSDDPDLIRISSKEQKIEMRRRDGLWQVEAPFQDRANQTDIDLLLNQLSQVTWFESFKRQDLNGADWKRSGLNESSAINVSIGKNGKTLAEAKFGNPGVIEGAVYASDKEKGEEVLHLTKSDVATLLHKPSEGWRDPKLLCLKASNVRSFAMAAGSGEMQFTREPGQPIWFLDKPMRTRASDERVNAILAAFLNLEAKFLPVAQAPSTTNSTAPAMTVTLTSDKSTKPLEVTMLPGATAADALATVSDRPGIFSVPPKITQIWLLQPNSMRDQRLAHIDTPNVSALRISSLSYGQVVLDKKGDSWTLTRHGVQEPGNGERIQQFFDSMNSATIREFSTDAPANLADFGLDRPFITVAWTQGGKTSTLHFGQGEVEVAGSPGIVSAATYAKYEDQPSVYRIAPLLLANVPADSIKWRGMSVLNLSIFSVHRIVIAEGAKPPMTLSYNPEVAKWDAEIAGKDVTAQLITSTANTLLNKLCSLQASDWSSDRSAAYAALRQPSLTVQLVVTPPGHSDGAAKPITLNFAPTAPNMDTAVYHGRVNDDADTFLISRDLYHDLVAPVVTAEQQQ